MEAPQVIERLDRKDQKDPESLDLIDDAYRRLRGDVAAIDTTALEQNTEDIATNVTDIAAINTELDTYWYNVRDYGALGDGATDDSAAIQAAWDAMKNTGGVLFFPFAPDYRCDSAIDFRKDSSGHHYRYTIMGNQSRLNFSSSGLTSGDLVAVGATSQANTSQYGHLHIDGLHILGPETAAKPAETGAAGGSTVGLALRFALQVNLTNIHIRACYKGIYANFAFPISATNVDLYHNFVGLHCGDDVTFGSWTKVSCVENRFGIILSPDTATKTTYGQNFYGARFEDCWVGCILDPLNYTSNSIGIRSCSFFDTYNEGVDNEVFRIGRSYDIADASDQGTDRTRYVNAITIDGGVWDSGAGWGAGHEPILFPATKTARPVVGVEMRNLPFAYAAVENIENVEVVTFSGSRDPYVSLANSQAGMTVDQINKNIGTLANEATPSVHGYNVWKTGGTTGITDFDDGVLGQVITILAEHTVEITDNANIYLKNNTNWTMVSSDTLTLIQKANGSWYEIGRGELTSEYEQIQGDGTIGRVLRVVQLEINDGTNVDTLKCTVTSVWNGDTIGATDNVAKGATTGSFTLDAGGQTLTIENGGLSGNVLMTLGALKHNASGADVTADVDPVANDIEVVARASTSSVAQDMTALVDVGLLRIQILYMTDA
jgi:hypothetical protein